MLSPFNFVRASEAPQLTDSKKGCATEYATVFRGSDHGVCDIEWVADTGGLGSFTKPPSLAR